MAKKDLEIEALKAQIQRVEEQILALERAPGRKKGKAHKKKIARAKLGLARLHRRHKLVSAKVIEGTQTQEGGMPLATDLEKIKKGDSKPQKVKNFNSAKSQPEQLENEPMSAIISKSPVHQLPLHMAKKEPSHSASQRKPPMHSIYHWLSRLASRTQRMNLRQKLSTAGINEDEEIWLGQFIILAKLCGLAAFMIVWVVFREAYLPTLLAYAILAFAAVMFGAYVHLNVQIEDRKKRLESVLPEAMLVIAANIRAGMTPVVALRASARPEFGPIQEDIKLATTKSLGTDSFTDALSEMARKTNSELFQRVLALFTASLRSGGHLAQLLENTAEDIRQAQELKKDLATSTRLYGMFILFTVIIGTPLLLAVSIQFSTMVSGLQQQTATGGIASEISSSPLISTPLPVDFLSTSAIFILVITSLLASGLIGVINNGSYNSGLRYSPFIVGSALLIFFLIKDFGLKLIMPVG
ncbi:MAG TPA: type II secretion system F family protein [Candidatus Norongarragalinales archaeon]|nr:type II secretion system F family protein [Candidatus Norongarragalinales archaeon]